MKRDVVIQGSTARAITAAGKLDTAQNFRTVKEAYEAEAELGRTQDENELHHCPLCNTHFPWEAFKAHAPECIKIRIPRRKVWAPGGGVPVETRHRKYGEVG